MRIVLLGALLLVAAAQAQSSTTSPITVSVTPPGGGPTTARDVRVEGLEAGSGQLIWLLDPNGVETGIGGPVGSDGTLVVHLPPPVTGWVQGMYRVVVPLADGTSVSATFAVDSGQPFLAVRPDAPSVTSALDIAGIGLPPASPLDLSLVLTGGLGDRTIHVTTDAAGTFSLLVWPQQVGLDFFPAGPYRLLAPSLSLEADVTVREHPLHSNVSVDDPVLPGSSAPVHFNDYRAGRYVWAVYASMDGRVLGQFFVGPMSSSGSLTVNLPFGNLEPGRYLLATPYDWGETIFDVPAPTDTPTSTPTATPTATPTETVTPTAGASGTAAPSARRCTSTVYVRRCHRGRQLGSRPESDVGPA